MDPAIHIPPAAVAALSAQPEFLKNPINIDKFTGFFDKKLKGKTIVIYRVDVNILVCAAQIKPQKFQTSAFARICDESSAVSRISPQVLHPPHPLPGPGPRPEKPGWILTPK